MSGMPIATITSVISHGGTVITGSPDRVADGLAVARLNDLVNCTDHGVNAIVGVTNTQETNGRLTASVGSICHCGAVITTGINSILIG